MPPAVPCVSECSSLATGTPAFVVVGRCSAAVMTKSPRLLVTVLELGLGGDGGQLLDGDGQLRVLVRLDSVRLGSERSQQVPVAAHVVPQGCDVTVLGRLQAVRMPVEGAASWSSSSTSVLAHSRTCCARWPQSPGRAGSGRRRDYPPSSGRSCLLYTSDAADEEDSVDLGGR